MTAKKVFDFEAAFERGLCAEERLAGDMQMNRRISLATGAVVAGVIGRRKFSHDFWGDTVNISARMSAEVQPGFMQVDAVTFRRLHNRYSFDEMQQIHVKGKGPMQVYNLLGRTRTMPQQ